MKTGKSDNTVRFIPDNTYDAFQLGRLYEKTLQKLRPGLTVGSDKGVRNELCGIRFDAVELVDYLLNRKE